MEGQGEKAADRDGRGDGGRLAAQLEQGEDDRHEQRGHQDQTRQPHGAAHLLGERFFPGVPVFGAGLPGMATKPDPGLVWYALEQLGASREGAVYVGDSDVDIATARNAGLDLAVVSWGFRDRRVLEELGAQQIADDVPQLLEILTQTPAGH